MNPKKIGIYGGTFDPPHFGHLNLALSIKEKCNLGKVLVVPAKINPHKIGETPTDPLHRWNMAVKTFQGMEGFEVLDIELKREGPSYTIDTLRFLHQSLPDTNLFLLIGEDLVPGLHRWKGIQEISKLAEFLAGTRDLNTSQLEKGANNQEAIPVTYIPIPLFDISATEVRSRLQRGKECRHLVPKEILDYICQNRLY